MKKPNYPSLTPLSTGRRGFLKQISAAGLASCLPGVLGGSVMAASTPAENTPPARDAPPMDKIWACMLHLSFNFALGINSPKWTHPRMGQGLRTEFEPEQSVWDAAIKEMTTQKINMLLVNLDDSVLWRSHPEIALKNSWTPEKLHEELAKIRKLGIEPIPLLNFSTSHDAWMGKYSRMVSSQPYYKVCRDLIAEAIEIFDTPRFIHFGMDEETSAHGKRFDYIVVRQFEHWWGDLYFYCSEAMMRGVRPWVWSDYYWHHPETFLKMMPKYVVQSNWYYREEFNLSKSIHTKTYLDLAAAGYDQIPTGSNDGILQRGKSNDKNIGNTVDFCTKHIPDSQLLGFLQSMWMPTIEKFQPNILNAIRLTGNARKQYETRNK